MSFSLLVKLLSEGLHTARDDVAYNSVQKGRRDVSTMMDGVNVEVLR